MKFRETTPKRQNITKEVSDYHEHKINLQKDFRGHCGYCNDRWFCDTHLRHGKIGL